VQDDVAGVVLYGPVHAGTELVGVVTVGIRTDRLFASLADGALGFTVTDLGAGETMWTSAPREGPSISADLAFADRIYRVEGWAAYAPAGAWRAAITVGGGAALLVALALALGVVMIRGAERLKAEADARAEAESRLAVIVRELNHRVRNVLAVAGALTTQTLRKAGDVDGARTALVDRLHAMGNALKVLDLAHGEGPDIHVLFAPDMLPGAQAIEARGPALKLNAYATQALALVLYELATNAVKHGGEEDRTRAAWRVDDDRFVLVWDETRAQPTAEAPAATGSGFGRDLVERIGPRMIDARATWKATERGVRYELDAPLARVGRLEAA
jgi:two-component sensor histidine kinase